MLAKAFLIIFCQVFAIFDTFSSFCSSICSGSTLKNHQIWQKKLTKNEEKSCLLHVPKPLVSHTNLQFFAMYICSPPSKKNTSIFFSSLQNFFQKTIISHPATMSNQDHPHFVLFFYLLPAPGQIWSRSLISVRFHIFNIWCLNSSLASSIFPSVFIESEVRTSANNVALKFTEPSELRGIFIDTRRWKRNTCKTLERFVLPVSLPDPLGGKILSRIFWGVRFHTFITMALSSALLDSIEPSIFIRRDVRIRAKRVAVKVTVPSAFRGIFIATNRWNINQPKTEVAAVCKLELFYILEILSGCIFFKI